MYDFNAAKFMASNWEGKNASHTRLETASWKAAALTSLGLWCWNSSPALRVATNEALGRACMGLDGYSIRILSSISETTATIPGHSRDVHT